METKSEETPRKSRIAAVLVFLMHQVMAYWVVSVSAKLPVALAADLLWPFGVRIHHFPVILTLPPYYPLQIIWALFLGWSLSGYLRHQSMLWVWVIPTVVLSCVFIQFPARPVLLPDRAVLSSSSGLSHFFGWGCRVKDLCLDQITFTQPFYCATAYSLGAWRARKMSWLSRYTEVMGNAILLHSSSRGTVAWSQTAFGEVLLNSRSSENAAQTPRATTRYRSERPQDHCTSSDPRVRMH